MIVHWYLENPMWVDNIKTVTIKSGLSRIMENDNNEYSAVW